MLDALLAELRAAGHLHGEVLPPPDEAVVSRWILALQVGGGWLAAIFLLLFLGLGAAPLIEGAAGWLAVGLLMTALTGLLMGRVAGTVARQFLLVASLAGHGALLVGAGLFDRGESGGSFLMVALYEFVLLFRVAWMPHRLVAALLGAGALAAAGYLALTPAFVRYCAGVYWFAACLLWLAESRWQAQRHGEALYALACALTLLCLAYALGAFFSAEFFPWHPGFRSDTVLLSAVSVAFVLLQARSLWHDVRRLGALGLLLAALGVTWQAPAVGLGALALLFGFARGHRWLLWLGGAVLLFGVGRFYYDLQLTLLDKSALMALGGGLLLAVRALLGAQEEDA
jgi:hypothetical protein